MKFKESIHFMKVHQGKSWYKLRTVIMTDLCNNILLLYMYIFMNK